MLTESMKKAVCFRLNESFVKYTVSAGYYWDKRKKRFVPTESYLNWSFYGTYYLGQVFQFTLALFLYYNKDMNADIPEDPTIDFEKDSEESKSITFLLGTTLWIAITAMLAFGSVVAEHRFDMIESTNQLFRIDEKLKAKFPHVQMPEAKMTEDLMRFSCYFTAILPIVFIFPFFHPTYPIRVLFESLFELPVTIGTPFGWFVMITQSWAVISFTGQAICLLTMAILSMHQLKQWQNVATTVGPAKWKNGEIYFDTVGLGVQSGDQLIWLNRSLKMLMDITNLTYSNVKIAYHATVAIVILTISNFLMIRYGGYLLSDGTLMAYAIIILLLIAIFGAVLIMYSECYLLEGVNASGSDFKNGLLAVTPRKSRMYKAIRSIKITNLNTTYPFIEVNIGTFLEWCDSAVNNLVNLLVM